MNIQRIARSFPVDSDLLTAVLEHVEQGIMMVDANGYVAVCNQRAIDLLGLPHDLMRSNPSFEAVKRWQLEKGEFGTVTKELLRAIKYEGITVEILDYERQRPDGTVLEVRSNRLPNGGMVRTFTDITIRKAAENAIRVSEERLRLALQASRMAAWELDLETQWVDRSENSLVLLGLSSGPAADFIARVHPDDREKVPAFWSAVMADGSGAAEMRYFAPDGSQTWLAVRAERKERNRLIGLTFDIADRKATEEAIWRTANHDPLTGLANRALFQLRLNEALTKAEASGTGVGLLMLDLDDFKDVNDTLGHAVGDLLLREAALRLGSFVGAGDTVARLGGDEFAIILADIGEGSEATARAADIVEALRAPFQHEGRALSTTLSIGLATFPEHHRDPIELMKDADIALYRAKEQGRSQAVVYTSAARETMEHRVTIARDVREGLAAHQFVPYYQPKISLLTGRIVGLEALARWKHPAKGVLTPAYFGSMFAEQAISIELGEQMIRQVVADVRSWLDRGLACGRVAVNLSSAEISDPRLADRIIGILDEAGVSSEHFEVEVTETAFLGRRTATASLILNKLHEAGISIALDDFGTGFASLLHLKQFPVDHIKIDQNFVRNLISDESDAAIVAAIVSLAHAMGMHTTAEGVENAEQAARLRDVGCVSAQGFFYARPLQREKVPQTLLDWQAVETGL
ncbi:EAL domain-containing protein [Bosea sp. TND4EK4]|uniref:EAL domain-containing protein n=1 Tax=Bosea sp. TND4EK4 TaxID=1907408 RepID=UPI000956A104|nr:EAL domain-containing protein [Bosea sp. TND4EK4]SIR33379.1 diguanylate cyclase (GGDEF) domain-containing protein [Bosea sp. TND4EK4]